ncbi:hypothetical protein TRAPUB_11691 [Trametes pubescens]|uniref:Uncharacterized protein n=1 Tax=Trametes pubescens TaxID=154538 RepID=A0A1M2VVX9_TRAPU|nr:hypothetical protein TRAPUB_11691 [Trametes pubescens]
MSRELGEPEMKAALEAIQRLETDILEAQDNLLLAKAAQATHVNHSHGEEPHYSVGDKVLLSTFHQQCEYMQCGSLWVAKCMVQFNGPYTISCVHPDTLSYPLNLLETMNTFPTFHPSLLCPYLLNDDSLFPGRVNPEPSPIVGVCSTRPASVLLEQLNNLSLRDKAQDVLPKI